MNAPAPIPTDARTPPVAVWQLLEKLRGQDLADWRVAPLDGRPTPAERGLDVGFPFGWYAIEFSDFVAPGQAKRCEGIGMGKLFERGDRCLSPEPEVADRVIAAPPARHDDVDMGILDAERMGQSQPDRLVGFYVTRHLGMLGP